MGASTLRKISYEDIYICLDIAIKGKMWQFTDINQDINQVTKSEFSNTNKVMNIPASFSSLIISAVRDAILYQESMLKVTRLKPLKTTRNT